MAMSGVPETPKKLKKTKVDTGAAHKKACRAAYAVTNRMQNMMIDMEEPCRPANRLELEPACATCKGASILVSMRGILGKVARAP